MTKNRAKRAECPSCRRTAPVALMEVVRVEGPLNDWNGAPVVPVVEGFLKVCGPCADTWDAVVSEGEWPDALR